MPSTPKKTVETVLASGNHLLVQLKGNQPSLHQAMAAYADPHPCIDHDRLHNSGRHSRIENRIAEVWHLPPGVGTEPWHDHFRALIRVQRSTNRFDTQIHDWRPSADAAYYLCDQRHSAAEFNQIIRSHWAIENRLHHVRDVCLGEDASRIRCNPCIFALLRSFALNLLRFNGIQNIRQALFSTDLLNLMALPWSQRSISRLHRIR